MYEESNGMKLQRQHNTNSNNNNTTKEESTVASSQNNGQLFEISAVDEMKQQSNNEGSDSNSRDNVSSSTNYEEMQQQHPADHLNALYSPISGFRKIIARQRQVHQQQQQQARSALSPPQQQQHINDGEQSARAKNTESWMGQLPIIMSISPSPASSLISEQFSQTSSKPQPLDKNNRDYDCDDSCYDYNDNMDTNDRARQCMTYQEAGGGDVHAQNPLPRSSIIHNPSSQTTTTTTAIATAATTTEQKQKYPNTNPSANSSNAASRKSYSTTTSASAVPVDGLSRRSSRNLHPYNTSDNDNAKTVYSSHFHNQIPSSLTTIMMNGHSNSSGGGGGRNSRNNDSNNNHPWHSSSSSHDDYNKNSHPQPPSLLRQQQQPQQHRFVLTTGRVVKCTLTFVLFVYVVVLSIMSLHYMHSSPFSFLFQWPSTTSTTTTTYNNNGNHNNQVYYRRANKQHELDGNIIKRKNSIIGEYSNGGDITRKTNSNVRRFFFHHQGYHGGPGGSVSSDGNDNNNNLNKNNSNNIRESRMTTTIRKWGSRFTFGGGGGRAGATTVNNNDIDVDAASDGGYGSSNSNDIHLNSRYSGKELLLKFLHGVILLQQEFRMIFTRNELNNWIIHEKQFVHDEINTRISNRRRYSCPTYKNLSSDDPQQQQEPMSSKELLKPYKLKHVTDSMSYLTSLQPIVKDDDGDEDDGELPENTHQNQDNRKLLNAEEKDQNAVAAAAAAADSTRKSANDKDGDDEGDDEESDLPQLCGINAQSSASSSLYFSSPAHYLTSSSKVVITGILSNPVGIHLALALYHRCGVTTILGLDPLLPNNALHRLHVQEQISILRQTIPRFALELPWIGVHPSPSLQKIRKARNAGFHTEEEYDIMKEMGRTGATHIVHLATVEPQIYARFSGGGPGEDPMEDGSWEDQNRQEVDDEELFDNTSSWWSIYGAGRPLNLIRQGMVGIEQILQSIVSHKVNKLDELMKEKQKAEEESGRGLSERTVKPGTKSEMNFPMEPNFVYASSLNVYNSAHAETITNEVEQSSRRHRHLENDTLLSRHANFGGATNIMDEVIASAYSRIHNIQTIGLRMGKVYGPWDHSTSEVHSMARKAVTDRTKNIWSEKEQRSKWERRRKHGPDVFGEDYDGDLLIERDYVFVDDAVDAIVSALQFRPSQPTGSRKSAIAGVFNIGTETVSSLQSIGQGIERIMPRIPVTIGDHALQDFSRNGGIIGALNVGNKLLNWSPKTSLDDGIAKLLAWHFEQVYPHGVSKFQVLPAVPQQEIVASKLINDSDNPLHDPDGNGFQLAKKYGANTCQSNGSPNFEVESATSSVSQECLRGKVLLPCASECGGRDNYDASPCTPTVFDSILEASAIATEDCTVVLYTVALGFDVATMPHRLSRKDEALNDRSKVCNVAFIPRESKLAEDIVRSIPYSEVEGEELIQSFNDKISKSQVESRLDLFNGQVDADGWTAVWVPKSATSVLSIVEQYLLKIAPGRMFSPSVKYSMFVDRNFPVSPTQDDVLFLVSEMQREALPERTTTYKNDGTKRMYRLPPEPARRSILLAAPIRKYPNIYRVSVYMATKIMTADNGGNPETPERSEVTPQRIMYEKAPGILNKEDGRSSFAPLHRFATEQFYIRSRWLIHDFILPEARQLRCDWFAEHAKWCNDLDQLSFSFVMAKRELTRKIVRGEMDHRALAKLPEYPEELTDKKDWYGVLTHDKHWTLEEDDEGATSVNAVPDHLMDSTDRLDDLEIGTLDETTGQGKRVGLYVRIMGDREMMKGRKNWITRKKMTESLEV